MADKAIMQSSDSKKSAVKVSPRNERRLTLTPLGHKAVAWIDKHYPLDDEFAFVCEDCELPLSKCDCSGR